MHCACSLLVLLIALLRASVLQAWAICVTAAVDHKLPVSHSFLEASDAFWVSKAATLFGLKWHYLLQAHYLARHQPSAALLTIIQAQVLGPVGTPPS